MARLFFAVFQKGLLPALYTAFILTALLAPADMAPIRVGFTICIRLRRVKFSFHSTRTVGTNT